MHLIRISEVGGFLFFCFVVVEDEEEEEQSCGQQVGAAMGKTCN